jgi:hypothetical protein
VCITAHDRRETLYALREIHRPINGKPYLAKLEIKQAGAVDRIGNLLSTMQ